MHFSLCCLFFKNFIRFEKRNSLCYHGYWRILINDISNVVKILCQNMSHSGIELKNCYRAFTNQTIYCHFHFETKIKPNSTEKWKRIGVFLLFDKKTPTKAFRSLFTMFLVYGWQDVFSILTFNLCVIASWSYFCFISISIFNPTSEREEISFQ